jgi:hypothetical protein
MKKAWRWMPIAVCLAASLVVGGCVNAWYVRTGDRYPAKARDCDIEVFTSGLPARDYEEIALLEGEGNLWKAELRDILPKLKEQACLAGGDAILLNPPQRFAEGEQGSPRMYASATVIRW